MAGRWGGQQGMFQSGISGSAEIDRKLRKFERKIENKTLKKAMKKALKIFKKPVRKSTPKDRGNLRKSVATRALKRGDKLYGNVYFRFKDPYKAYHAHLVEFGTKAHIIKNYFGHKGVGVKVGGQKGQRMAKKGWEAKKRYVVNSFKRELRQAVRALGITA